MKKTPGKGSGSFAVEKIVKGEIIASFGGYVVDSNSLNNYSKDRVARSLQLNHERYLLSGIKPEPGDMLNHSCEPNCGAFGTSSIKAMRDIEIGEELTFDYAMTDASEYDEFICECKNSKCRKKITGNDWLNLNLQDKYLGHFSSHIAHLMEFSKTKRTNY